MLLPWANSLVLFGTGCVAALVADVLVRRRRESRRLIVLSADDDCLAAALEEPARPTRNPTRRGRRPSQRVA